ncbi:MAG: hypothetical protein WBP41_09825 [Saprospiraceae bacterium]
MRNQNARWMAKGISFRIVMFALMGLLVMLLWNNIVVITIGLKSLSYLQSLGLLLLVRILTGHIGPGGRHGPGWMMQGKGLMRERWMNMHHEERKQWLQRMDKGFDATESDDKVE